MSRIQVVFLSLSALLFWQCGTQNKVASNYYDDGLYFDPSYENLVYGDENDEPITPESSTTEDYYEPGQYTSPYDQGSNSGSFYGNAGMNSMYGYNGWNSGLSMSMGYSWGTPMYGYGYDPFYGGYGSPYYPYYPYYGMGYNPYCPGYGGFPGYGYGGYPGFGGYPPYTGYPGYGGYPSGGDGGYWNSNQPDIIFVGNSGPRGGRNNINSNSTNNENRPAKGGKIAATPPNTEMSSGLTSAKKSSKLREATSGNGKTFTSTQPSYSDDNLFQKATRNATETRNSERTLSRNVTPNNSATRNNTLSRQTNEIINSTLPNRTYNRSTNSGSTIHRGSSGNSGNASSRPQNTFKPNNSGSSRPSSSGASRPSSSGSRGGATRGGSKK